MAQKKNTPLVIKSLEDTADTVYFEQNNIKRLRKAFDEVQLRRTNNNKKV